MIGSNAYYSMAVHPDLLKRAAGDVFSYRQIAEAAPRLPETGLLPFHHAQRFLVPAVVGLAARITGVPSETMARVAVVLLFLAGLVLTRRFLADVGAGAVASVFLAALVFLNPYAVRLDLAFAFMLNDLVFLVGMVMVLAGLTRRRAPVLLSGVVIAAFARQTALLLLLPLALVAIVDLRRKSRPAWPLVLAVAGALAIGIYVLTAMVAAGMSRATGNVQLVLDLVTWVRQSFSVRDLLELYGRGITAHLVVLAVLLALLATRSAWRQRAWGDDAVLGWAFLLLAAAIVVQPLAIDPSRTRGNLQRLTTAAHWPLVVGAYLIFRGRFEAFFAAGPSRIVLAVGLLVYSQHHLFSWPGQLLLRRPEAFVVVQAVLAVATFVWMRRIAAPATRRG